MEDFFFYCNEYFVTFCLIKHHKSKRAEHKSIKQGRVIDFTEDCPHGKISLNKICIHMLISILEIP